MATESIVTETTHGGQPHTVDREKGIIRRVKIAGKKSGNGYEYASEAYRDSLQMYEGMGVNADHGQNPNAKRSVRDRIGWLQDCVLEGQEPFGDLHLLNPIGEFETKLMNAAERAPKLFGLSQVARVRWKTPQKTVAESILAVKSVDIVSDPATTGGIFEEKQMNLKSYRDSLPAGTKAHKLISLVCEMDGMGELPVDAPAVSTDPDQALKDGIIAAMYAALESFKAGNIAGADMLAKIKELYKTFEKATGSAEAAEAPAEPPAEESKKVKPSTDPAVTDLQEQLRTLTRKDQARTLLDAEGVKASPVLLKALVRCENDAEMKELIQEHKTAKGDSGLKSEVKGGVQTVQESKDFKVPDSKEALAKLVVA